MFKATYISIPSNINAGAIDWNSYFRCCLNYPASLNKMVMEYHHARLTSQNFAHHIGSKHGMFAFTLAECFLHVHVSDPCWTSLSYIRAILDQWHTQNSGKGRFSFAPLCPGSILKFTVPRSVDLTFVMLNFLPELDINQILMPAATELVPNGTLALIAYSPACTVVDNAPKVDAAVRNLFAAWAKEMLSKNPERIKRMNSPLDYVVIPGTLFAQENTIRIKVNFRGRRDDSFSIPGVEDHFAASPMHPASQKLYIDLEHEQLAGWRREADAQWFRDMIAILEDFDDIAKYEPYLVEVEESLNTRYNKRVIVEWSAAILLATRK